jgi:hypothetical protein
MTPHSILLAFHITCGVIALAIGVVAMVTEKSRGLHTLLGNIYHWVYVALAVSAFALSASDWQRLWWLTPIGVFSYAFAFVGFLAAKLRWKGWMQYHITGQLGSFIAMTTAVLVVNAGNIWWAWIAPTIVGSPIIAWLQREVRAGRRPKYRPRGAHAVDRTSLGVPEIQPLGSE